LLGALLLLPVVFLGQVTAQDGGRAAVVVRFDDERTESRCVAFSEEEVSGYALLQRSGLSLDVKSDGQGGLVCAIDGTGCGAGDCLCQCKGEPCIYWSYWRLADDGWTYSAVGSTIRRISDGDVDGWSWGPGSVTSAIEPPTTSFEEICSDGATVYDGTAEEAPDEPINWLPYAVLGLLVVIIGLVLLLRRGAPSES
jgi:hypothetical protein